MLPVTTGKRDPAPSRLRYRLTRLWLRRSVRRLVRLGLPVAACVAGMAYGAAHFEVRARAAETWEALRVAFIDQKQFQITRLEVRDVSPALAEQIRAAAFVHLPQSSLNVDVAAIRSRIEALDAVERASVRALAGGLLEIRALERQPVVLWRAPSGLQLLDAGGVRVAEVDSRLRRPDLPLIAGAGAGAQVPEALALLADAAPVADRVRGLVRVGARRWDLVLDRDQVIRLPEEAPEAALQRVMALHQAEELLSRDLTVVDMRNPRRPMLRLTEHAQSELIRLKLMVQGEDA